MSEDLTGGWVDDMDAKLGIKHTSPPPADSKIDKWQRWLSQIDLEITTIFQNRAVWRTVNNIVAANPSLPPSHFFEYMAQTYVTSQAAAVRRQAEIDTRVVSLGILLREIATEPERLSRRWYVSQYPKGTQWMGHEHFTKELAGPGCDHLDPAKVQADLKVLADSTAPIKRYVDQHIAHYDRSRRLDQIPTFNDLDEAIDVLGRLLKRYLLLLRQADRDPIEPVPQYDWVAPFRVPWIAPDQMGESTGPPTALE